MGVPGWIKFLQAKRYKNVEMSYIPGAVNNMMVDANGVFHTAAQKAYSYGEYEDEKKQEELKALDQATLRTKLLDQIVIEINDLIHNFKPREKQVIAVDGTCSIAKCTQQRQRRFKNIVNRSGDLVFDSSSISVGTDLMFDIDSKIRSWLGKTYIFLTPTIIYSSHLTPNEGETKLFMYLKNMEFTGNTVIVGLDWDLMFLSVLSNQPNLYLSRKNQNDIISIDNFRQALRNELLQESCVQDFCLMSFLIGTDFLPRMIAFSDIMAAYEKMFIAYKAVRAGLTDGSQIIWSNFLRFIKELNKHERELLIGVATAPVKYKNPVMEASFNIIQNPGGKSTTLFDFNVFRGNYYTNIFNPKVKNLSPEDIQGFIPNADKVSDMCINYLTMLQWNFLYYMEGPLAINNGYYYRYGYAPLIFDLVAIVSKQTEANLLERYVAGENDITFNPLQQLIATIPPASKLVLPEILLPFTYFDSPVYDLFIEKFELDKAGKNQDHEAVALLPPIDAETIANKVIIRSDSLAKYLPVGDYLYQQTENNEFLKEQIRVNKYIKYGQTNERKDRGNEEGER